MAVPTPRSVRMGGRQQATWLLPSETNGTRRRITRDAAPVRSTGCIRPGATRSRPRRPRWAGPTRRTSTIFNRLRGDGLTIYDSAQNYLTNVGAYLKSVSAYGTFDQGGDVFQWNEALIDSSRGLRGGLWGYYSGNLASSSRSHDIPTLESYFVGFRVASVP